MYSSKSTSASTSSNPTNPFGDDPSVKSETTDATGRSGRSARSIRSETTIRVSNGNNAATGGIIAAANSTLSTKYITSPNAPSSSNKKSLTKALRKKMASTFQKKVTPKEITVCVQTLDREKEDLERTLEILRDDLKPLLMTWINQNPVNPDNNNNKDNKDKDNNNNKDKDTDNNTSKKPASGGKDDKDNKPLIDKNLGPVVVEVLRHNNTNAELVSECAGILYLLSIVNPNFKKAVARLFQAMQHHPTSVSILEDAALAIQNVVNANPDSHIRIAPSLPILWNAMARFPDNGMLVGAALNILEDLTFNPEMYMPQAKNGRCLTESIPAVLKVLETPTKEIKLQACRILAELAYYADDNTNNNNTNAAAVAANNNQQTIGFNLNFLLVCLRDGLSDLEVQAAVLEVLANVAVHVPSHKNFVNRRAVPTIIRCLTTLPDSACVVEACRALANLLVPTEEQVASLRRTAAPAVIESGGIPAVITAMRRHPNDAQLQIQACTCLHNVCLTAIQTSVQEMVGEIIGAGGIPTIIMAIRQHSVYEILQIQACNTLYHLCHSPETLGQFTSTSAPPTPDAIVQGAGLGGIGPLVRGMAFHSSIPMVQVSGLKVLSRLTLQEDFELLLSEGGLDVLLTNLHNFCDDPTICLLTCEILKSFTRSVSGQSRDLQMAVASKEGIPAILTVMRKHVSDPQLQDAALACMRNLVLHPNNRPLVDEGGISTILVSMTVNPSNAAIQAYGCDALGRISTDGVSEAMRYTIDVERGMQVALQAMKDHSAHPGVQDRVVFFLVNMTNDDPLALESLVQLKPLPLLKEARARMPQKGQERLETLISRLQKAGGGGGLMGSIFGRKN